MKFVKLGNLTSIQTGKIDVNKAVVGGKFPFFTCSRDVYEINDAPFEGKAVLVAGNGDLNVKYYEGKFNAYQRTYFLFVNNEEELLPRYLYWFLESYIGRLRSESIGSTIKYIKMGNLTDAEIPLPLLEKQIEIVEKLDRAFAEIDLLENNLELSDKNTNQLSQSLLSDAFAAHEDNVGQVDLLVHQGTDIKLTKLSEVCSFNPPKNEAREALTSDDLVSFMPMQDLGIESVFAEASVSRPLGEVIKAYTFFAENDVLIAKITPCFENGKMGIARNLVNGIGFGSSEYFVLRPLGTILSEYLYFFLRQKFVIENGRGVMTGAVGHRRVPGHYFENLDIPLPTLEKQREIVAKLETSFAEIDTIRNQIAIKKDFARMLRQSLLSQSFPAIDERVSA